MKVDGTLEKNEVAFPSNTSVDLQKAQVDSINNKLLLTVQFEIKAGTTLLQKENTTVPNDYNVFYIGKPIATGATPGFSFREEANKKLTAVISEIFTDGVKHTSGL